MEVSSLKKLITKLFDTLKTKTGETGCFSNPYCLLASQASIFLIQPLSQAQSVRTPLIPSKSMFLKLLSQKIHFQN